MKRSIEAVLALLLWPAAALAAGPVTFVGSIWERGGESMSFDMHVAPGQTKTMGLSGGQTVEMSVDAQGRSTVRLLAKGGEELHSSVSTADTPNPRRFQYALCRKGGVAFTSPPEKGRTGCP